MSGCPLYLNPEQYPFSAVIYTPLYLYLVYGICKLFSLNYVQDIHFIYVIGRVISLTFIFINLIYLDKFIRLNTTDKNIRISIAALFLILITGHAYAVRPDSMKICFFTMFIFYHFDHVYYSQKRSSFLLSLLFALLAILAKQDVIIYILLIQLCTILIFKKVKTILIFLISATSFALLFFLLFLIYGKYCITSLFHFNLQIISNYSNSYNLYVIAYNTYRLLPLCILLVYAALFNFQKQHLKVLCISGIIAFLLSTLSMLRPGSYLNYSYEFIIISIFLISILVSQKIIPRQLINYLIIYLMLVFATDFIIKIKSLEYTIKGKYHTEYKDYLLLRKKMLPLLQNNERLYSTDLKACIFFPDKNIIYGHEYHLDRSIYAYLGLTSKSNLLLNSSKNYDIFFENGSVKYILVLSNKENKYLLHKYYPRYVLEKRIDNFMLYAYRR